VHPWRARPATLRGPLYVSATALHASRGALYVSATALQAFRSALYASREALRAWGPCRVPNR
jgi:hypothetical protein